MVTPERCAIPLLAPDGDDGFYNGTGFLARRASSGGVGLITAAHLPTNRQPTKTIGWSGWPDRMYAFLSETETVELRLFSPFSTIVRSPEFSYLEPTGMTLADMMGFFGPTNVMPIGRLRQTYDVVDLQLPPDWSIDQSVDVTAHGYPGLKEDGTWPYFPARMTTGKFVDLQEGPMLEAAMPTEKGYSGGPVFDQSDTFIGMHIGENDGVARIVPTEVLKVL